MSLENFEKAMDFVLTVEGGYSNRKNDRGGKTNLGITQNAYDAYRLKHGLPLNDVRNIDINEAKNLYYEDYWKASGADNIDDPDLAATVFDTAVLHGVGTAKMYLKHSNNDIDAIIDFRRELCNNLVKKYPKQAENLKGWNNRFDKLKRAINQGSFRTEHKLVVNPYEQVITDVIARQMEGLYSKNEISEIVHEALFAKTPAQELMSKTQNIYSNSDDKTNPPHKKHYTTTPQNGKWVTINGNHVFIEK